jgi:hypothetical protein
MKTHKRLTALFVTFAFLALLQVSAMPLRADQAPAPSGDELESAEQGPSVIEEEGTAPATAKKKSILPIIIGVLAVGAIAAVLALVVFKTKYDITGTWDFNFTSTSPAHTWTWTLAFSGDKKSGTFNDAGDTGKYTVDDKDVKIQYDAWNIVLTGKFDGKDKMTGSATFSGLTIGGKDITAATWTASRISSSSSLKPGAGFTQSLDGRKAKR